MLKAENIAKYYGAHAAVENLNLHINRGEVVGLLGRNGAGKTTTLRILSGLMRPSLGDVLVGGISMQDDPVLARAQMGFLPETPPLYHDMRVRAYLYFVARMHVPKGDVEANIDGALSATDLLHVQRAIIGTLSHGYHRRLGIAQTLVGRPQVVLLDEPTSGLDPLQVVHMRKLICGLRGRATILISSHVLSEIAALCDRIMVLDEGRIIAQGTEAQLARLDADAIRVLVEVRPGPHSLQTTLAKMDFVHLVGPIEETSTIMRAQLNLAHDGRDILCQALVEAGHQVITLALQPVPLEQTFLRLTKQHFVAQAAKEVR